MPRKGKGRLMNGQVFQHGTPGCPARHAGDERLIIPCGLLLRVDGTFYRQPASVSRYMS